MDSVNELVVIVLSGLVSANVLALMWFGRAVISDLRTLRGAMDKLEYMAKFRLATVENHLGLNPPPLI